MRYKELDLARGFTVMLMPAVHVTMLYGNEAVYHSWFGIVLNWIAEFPGAQLFMLLMGISFGLSDKKKRSGTREKIMRWLLIGYALNFSKFIIPAILGWMPASFYNYAGITQDFAGLVKFMLIGDIMQLAALSLAILSLLDKYGALISVFAGTCIIILSPVMWHCQIGVGPLNEFFSLVTGNDPLVFFPFFPWAVYPLAGLLIGKRLGNNNLNYSWLFFTGTICMIPGLVVNRLNFFSFEENLYRSLPLQTLYHLGFCFCWLFLCSLGGKYLGENLLAKLLAWCSVYITLIYCTQWTLIFWCISILPFRGLNLSLTAIYAGMLTVLVFLISKYLGDRKPNYQI